MLVMGICFLSKTALAEGVEVPGVGSVWESTSVYTTVPEDGSPQRKEIRTIKVDRLQDGRPVFAGKFQAIEGEIVESAAETVIYANECRPNVPAIKLAPPEHSNQCAFHVCRPPPEGETFIRTMTVYIPLFGCQPLPSTYTFTSVRKGEYNGTKVMIGKAETTLNGTRFAAWESYIQDGVGEIFATSPEKVTTYNKVIVRSVPYKLKQRSLK